MGRRRAGLAAFSMLLPLGVAGEAAAMDRQDTFQNRLEVLALVETLSADILASRSATVTLEAWCGAHGIASPAILKARLVAGAPDKPATAEQRQRLQVGPDEPIRYRNVQLACGSHIVSEADNWYVPARLSPEMNRILESTDTSFGRVVAALKPTRQTFAAALLWRPLPDGWEMHAPEPDHGERAMVIPPILFEHHAVLYTAQRLPFSEVAEHYTSALLDFRR